MGSLSNPFISLHLKEASIFFIFILAIMTKLTLSGIGCLCLALLRNIIMNPTGGSPIKFSRCNIPPISFNYVYLLSWLRSALLCWDLLSFLACIRPLISLCCLHSWSIFYRIMFNSLRGLLVAIVGVLDSRFKLFPLFTVGFFTWSILFIFYSKVYNAIISVLPLELVNAWSYWLLFILNGLGLSGIKVTHL